MVISRRLAPVLGLALLGTLLILVPLLATAWISFLVGAPGRAEYTLENYVTVLTDSFGFRVLLNTLVFAVGSTVIAAAIGAPLAWAVARTDLPFARTISLILGMVLVIPGFIQGMGWAVLLSPNIGLVNRLFVQVLGFAEPPFNIYSLAGMTLVQGLELVPPAFFMLLPVLLGLDASYEEASYLSGVSKLRTFFRVDLPLALPAIMAACIYLLILASTLFEVPAILGFNERIFVFSTMVYLIISASTGLPAYGLAAAYGCLVALVGVLLAVQYMRILGMGRKYATITGKGRRARIVHLGKWRNLAVSLVGLYFLLAIGLPLLTLVYFSLLPFFQLPSLQAVQSFTLRNYVNLIDRTGIEPFVNTGLLVLVVPVLVLALAIPMSWVVVRTRLPGRFIIDNVAFLPVAIPRIVIAVAILYLALIARGVAPLYGTLALIAVAHVVIFMGTATRTLNGAMIQIHPELEEAGRVGGAPLSRVLRRITVPLLKPALFYAWLWVLLLSFREVTVAVMLASPDNVVLPALIWLRWNAARPHEAAAAGVVLALLALLLLLVLRRRVEQFTSVGGVLTR